MNWGTLSCREKKSDVNWAKAVTYVHGASSDCENWMTSGR